MPDLHISIPNYRGWIEAPHHTSMVMFAHALGCKGRSFSFMAPTYTIIATARQLVVNNALADPECKKVLFVDDDMTWNPEDFFKLEREMDENDLDYVCGLCFKNSIPTAPCVFGLAEGEEEFNMKKPWWAFMTDYPEDQLFEIYASGMAFSLISKRMLQGMAEKMDGVWGDGLAKFNTYSHFSINHPLVHNEDIGFCMKARHMGYKLYCDSRVKIGHISKDRPIINEQLYNMHRNAADYSLDTPRMMPVSKDQTWLVRQKTVEDEEFVHAEA